MGLYVPKWKTNDRKKLNKVLKSVEKVTDQKTLKEIALQAHFREIRLAALDRISDQEILKELGTTFDPLICGAAMEKIEDEALIKEIVVRGSCPYVLVEAVKKIKRTDLLVDIACSNASEPIVCQALKQIEDLEVLKTVYFRSDRLNVRREIWKRLPLETAKQIAEERCVPEKEICEWIGAHCNAPGPKSHFIEPDYETGFVEHELICCELCGKPLWSRSRPTAVWGVWKGGYIDLQQWKDWKLRDGMWQAEGRNHTVIRIMTEDYGDCYKE